MLTTASWRGGIGQGIAARFGDCVANGACCRQILGLNATELDKAANQVVIEQRRTVPRLGRQPPEKRDFY